MIVNGVIAIIIRTHAARLGTKIFIIASVFKYTTNYSAM